MTAEQLRQQALAKRAEAKKIIESLGAGEALSTEDQARVDTLADEVDGLLSQAASIDRIEDLGKGLNPNRPALTAGNTAVGNPRFESDPKRGFSTPREFLTAVISASRGGDMPENLASLRSGDSYTLPAGFAPRSFAAGSDEQSTVADPYGGFLIPTQQVSALRTIGWGGDPTAGRTTSIPMTSPIVELTARVDKDHSTSVSGGLTVGRRIETQTVTASRMAMEKITMHAQDLMGLAYASNELLERSPVSFAALLEQGFRDEFSAAILDEKLNGSGKVGEYLGVMNSPCLVSVAKESNQTADTIVFANVAKMRARCWRYDMAVWLVNPDALPSLMAATDASGRLIWQQNMTEDAPQMLLGRPMFTTEFCKTVGDQGDIVLGNFGEFLEGTLTPVTGASSVHVRFVNNESTFRFITSNCGAPWWRSALTPKNGSNTLSPFVVLDARA